MIIIHTTIGFGSPKKAGTSAAHGSPLGVDEVAATKVALGWDPKKSFYVPDDVRAHMGEAVGKGETARAAWTQAVRGVQAGRIPSWRHSSSSRSRASCRRAGAMTSRAFDKPIATRSAGGKIMAVLAERSPVAARWRRRPRWLDQDDREGRRLREAGRRAQLAVRHSRARDGRDRQRPALSRRRSPLRLDVLRVLRLHAPAGADRGAQQAAGDLRVDARLGRSRRRRPDAPAGGAPDGAARDAAALRCSGRRTATRRPRRGGTRCPEPTGRPRSCYRARICRS